MRKHTINENYFERIDNEKKAYLLGFIFADGCVQILPTTSALTASQMERDKDILESMKKELLSDYPLLEISVKGTDQKKYNFYAYNRKLCGDLIKLGVCPRKSLILKFPDYLDEELVRHFIRGYFDGDGCIWDGKRKKMLVKDATCKNGHRNRIVHNVKFTFTGVDSFIKVLQEKLINEAGLNKTKLNYSKAKNPNNSTSKNVCSIEYSGRNNIKKIFHYMYDGATIFGKRKFNKFNEILCAFDEKSSNETELIAGNPLEP